MFFWMTFLPQATTNLSNWFVCLPVWGTLWMNIYSALVQGNTSQKENISTTESNSQLRGGLKWQFGERALTAAICVRITQPSKEPRGQQVNFRALWCHWETTPTPLFAFPASMRHIHTEYTDHFPSAQFQKNVIDGCLERTTVKLDTCGDILAAVVSLYFDLQLVLGCRQIEKTGCCQYSGTCILYAIAENNCVQSHPDNLNRLSGNCIHKPFFFLQQLKKHTRNTWQWTHNQNRA